MSLPQSVADVLKNHVTLEVESIDRMYLNVYQPTLQTEKNVYRFLRDQCGHGSVSSKHFQSITHGFIARIESFALKNRLPLRAFERKERKDDVAVAYRKAFRGSEGVLFIGKAQEKVRTFRTEGRKNPTTGQIYPWIVSSTAMVNQYYFYAMDEDFGPFFLKFSSYFPYNARLCINGHEYLKRQLAKEKIALVELDNGILRCANPQRMQEIAAGLSAAKIDALLRKWLKILPHPYTPENRQAGFLYDLSILQAEFSLTQVLDQPVAGRIFFEEVIRENLDVGRPDQVQLIFDRRVTKRTPGRFRTRVLTNGVIPSLHVDYKNSRIKQYFKEGRALRTETTINNTRDFYIGKRLENLPALRKIGFAANRRLLNVQKISRDCMVGESAFREVTRPVCVGKQRGSALPYGDDVVLALFQALLLMRLLPCGFRSRELREHVAPLLGKDSQTWTQGKMTYQLRRLRLHGLIERQEGTHRYEVTDRGLRIGLFFTRSYARVIRPGLSEIISPPPLPSAPLRQAMDRFEKAIDDHVARAKI
jgi:hypothetical protein